MTSFMCITRLSFEKWHSKRDPSAGNEDIDILTLTSDSLN